MSTTKAEKKGYQAIYKNKMTKASREAVKAAQTAKANRENLEIRLRAEGFLAAWREENQHPSEHTKGNGSLCKCCPAELILSPDGKISHVTPEQEKIIEQVFYFLGTTTGFLILKSILGENGFALRVAQKD